jgi:hypothetical protein
MGATAQKLCDLLTAKLSARRRLPLLDVAEMAYEVHCDPEQTEALLLRESRAGRLALFGEGRSTSLELTRGARAQLGRSERPGADGSGQPDHDP